MDDLIANSKYSLETAHQILDEMWEKHKYLRINIKTGKQRSLTMNRCLHLYLKMLADEMNKRGIEIQVQFGDEWVQIPCNEYILKEKWRLIQVAYTGLESTTEPSNEEYKAIYEIFNRFTATNWGISLEWPHNKDKQQE